MTHFIEDKPSTAEAIAKAGIESWLVPTSYMGMPPEGVRVGTLEEFSEAVTLP